MMEGISGLKTKVKKVVSEELDEINKKYKFKDGVRPYDLLDVSFSFGEPTKTGFIPKDFSIIVETRERKSWFLEIDVPSFCEMGQRLRRDFPSCGINVGLQFLGEDLSKNRGSFTLQL
ncbi:MAG: hypothetical protein NC819_03100 [Candidatus Omnitrophica bacterium]|nr:hypothetical protein [Candidatus Omnitrophota bacterium]